MYHNGGNSNHSWVPKPSPYQYGSSYSNGGSTGGFNISKWAQGLPPVLPGHQMNGDYPNGTKIKQEYPPAFYGGKFFTHFKNVFNQYDGAG